MLVDWLAVGKRENIYIKKNQTENVGFNSATTGTTGTHVKSESGEQRNELRNVVCLDLHVVFGTRLS